jgi:hypothetical protein
MVCSAAPLPRWKQAVGIDFVFEPGEKLLTRRRGLLATVMPTVSDVRADAAAKGHLLGIELLHNDNWGSGRGLTSAAGLLYDA